MRLRGRTVTAVIILDVALALTGMQVRAALSQAAGLGKINHVIVIYQENWSFDGLYGTFPGANGVANAGPTLRQVDKTGQPYATLPQPIDTTNLPEGMLAQRYVLADNFFHAAFGGSFLNHFWVVCACTPQWPNAPDALKAQLDAGGMVVKDGFVTPDGYAVNTAYTINTPHPARVSDPARLLPSQTMPTIGDRLEEKGISWAWYSGGWNDALAGRPDPLFQFHHQVFAYFARYADGTPGRAQHLRDEQDLWAALKEGTLPAVAFVKFLGPDNEHPGYADVIRGQRHTLELVAAVMQSPYWADSAIIITYDENGGR